MGLSELLFCPLRIFNGHKGYTCMKKLSMARTILWKESAQVHVVSPLSYNRATTCSLSPRNDPLHILIPKSFAWPVCKSVIWLGPETTKDCLIMVSQYIQFNLISTEHVPMQCLYFGYKCSQVHCNSQKYMLIIQLPYLGCSSKESFLKAYSYLDFGLII